MRTDGWFAARPLVACCLVAIAAPAWAEEPPEEGERVSVKASDRAERRDWPKAPPRPEVDERILYEHDTFVDAGVAVEELLEELAADVAELGPQTLSPLMIERLDVSENIDPGYAAILEARLIAALYRNPALKVVSCVECRSTQMRVEDGAWVVRQGITRYEDLEQIAQKYGARAVLRGKLTLRRNPDMLALDVQVAKTDGATVVFAEGYRFEATNALLYRGSDAAQSREARRQDLQDRIDGRPHFGHAVLIGAMMVPEGKDPLADAFTKPIVGAMALYRVYETFGTYRQFRVGINAGGFFHSSRLAGGIVSASLHGRVHRFSFYGPQVFVGVSAGGFLTGGGGNTFIGSASLEILFAERMLVQASASWMHPFLFAKSRDIGGIVPQGGVGFLW